MARPKKNTTKPKAVEQEELSPTNPDGKAPAKIDIARAALAKEGQRKAKRDPFIDKAVNWLKSETDTTQGDVQVDVRILLRQAYALNRVDPSATLGFLKQAKADGRLAIIDVDGVTMVRIANEQPAAEENSKEETPDTVSTDTVSEAKSLGEHLVDAAGRQTRLPFPHTVGTWVAYAKEGTAFTPAQILNMTTTGNVTIYDLKTEAGKKIKDVPAFEIAQLPAQEESRIRNGDQLAKLQKFVKIGEVLAQTLAKEEANEVEQSGILKATRKRIENLREKIDAHLCGVPIDGQQEIDLEDDATGTISDPTAASAPATSPTTAAERLLGRITGKDVLELTGDNQPWAQLSGATLKAEASNGKPQKIIPLTIEQAPGNWVCVDCQDGVAVLLRAYPKAEWSGLYAAKYGEPRDLPNQDQTTVQAAGGPFTGCPVKVVRATLYLSPLDDALLLRLPAATAQA